MSGFLGSKPTPPRRADALLAWFCDAALIEDVLGDTHELFYKRVRQHGLVWARLQYWWDVLWFLRPYLFRRRSAHYEQAVGFIMWKNYSKVAARSLRKHKGYAAINLFGLASGMACCILLYFFVQHELTYNHMHANLNTLYKVDGHIRDHQTGVVPAPLAPLLVEQFPEVAQATRIADENVTMRYQEELFQEKVHVADAAFFDMFTFPMRAGGHRLERPQTVVISAEQADKYFGGESPVGKSIDLYINDQFMAFEVVGVTEPMPSNSSIVFDFVVPMLHLTDLQGERALTNWGSYSVTTFIQLQPGQAIEHLAQKMPTLVREHIRQGSDEEDPQVGYTFQAFADYHFGGTSKRGSGLYPPGQFQNIYILSGIAVLIMLMASFNFMNLTIGRAATRLKELGMRKVLGARRRQLVSQLWGEAIVLSMLALGLGVAGANALLPLFNELAQVSLTMNDGVVWTSVLVLLGIGVGVGVLAGLYPALALSRFNVVAVYQGMAAQRGGNGFRRVLVTLQFALSLSLMMAALVIARQHAYLQSKELGFEEEALVVVSLPTTRATRAQGDAIAAQFQQALAGQPGIVNTTASSAALVHGASASFFQEDGQMVIVFDYRVDEHFLETTGIELVSGRNFSPDFPSDKEHAILVNEAFVQRFGTEDFPSDAVGVADPTVIGVVKDFHFHRLHEAVAPLYLRMNPNRGGAALRNVLVRIQPNDVAATLARLEETWAMVQPDKPFEYFFLDEELDQQYKAEERWATILQYAALLAIVIACLGLLGLTALATARRTKEIGIRKVMGASVTGLVGLLSREFLVLMVLANVIAWPLAYWAMSRWLEEFAYQVQLGPELFIGAAIITLAVTWSTVAFQALKAARANPVQALRYE